ncbi:hypothetical protein FQN54_003793 [Arachnomyces sp. PD_36]|nr:hypothetical protein FQN54_003793 [Arachnomyces sp. PD_36]
MVTTENAPEPGPPAIGSTETALCIIPPAHQCRDVDRLRMLYDKSYGKWPAHINVIYPFVAAEDLPRAMELVRSKLASPKAEPKCQSIDLRLSEPGYFTHRYRSTLYITDNGADDDGIKDLERLRGTILSAFNHSDQEYRSHLTIGQSGTEGTSELKHLLEKVRLLPPIEFQATEFVVLFREKVPHEDYTNQMKIWGTIDLNGNIRRRSLSDGTVRGEEQEVTRTASSLIPSQSETQTAQTETTFRFSPTDATWKPYQPSGSHPDKDMIPASLTVSSYNVLVDSTYSSRQDRYSLLLWAILSESALADVLVLQEVSDDFLSYLLSDTTIRERYPFTTHGPPNQPGIGPLTSLCNIVVLCRWSFGWNYVPFQRRHKGAAVLTMETVGEYKETQFFPLVIAGVHLTCGLTDGSVAAKKSQLQTVVNYLSKNYSGNPWIVAGDFNITTSATTIDDAVRSKSISLQTANTLSAIETMLADVQLSDAWFIARAGAGEIPRPGLDQEALDDLRDGEEGATFDPTANSLAAEIVARGFTHRPQRYDRILVKGENLLRVTGFNMFGTPGDSSGETYDLDTLIGSGPYYGSDHWGIRTSLKVNGDSGAAKLAVEVPPLEPRKAPTGLADLTGLKACLEKHSMFPSEEEVTERRVALATIRGILQQSPTPGAGEVVNSGANIAPVVVPVGSYGMGVWNTSSDIDCLCVGSISTKLFFTIAGQRFVKAAGLGVRILRKVTAASGTMLELDIKGVKVDLQYCPAAQISVSWPSVIQLPESNPAFYLPIQSLGKLAPFRDLDYLQRTIPDLAAFRIAHRFIKAWATHRGIYSSKFGYLGGIHITLMLSRVCKLLFRDAGAVTASDIICTFFHHYANFDWKTQMVFDPFFYKEQPRPHQSAREPMVILGLHAPRVNVAHTASLPSTKTVIEELKRAERLLSDAEVTWPKLIGDAENESQVEGEHEFLNAYSSYIKINVQYWGVSPTKGNLLVGWLESRCVPLLVDFNRKLPDIHARIWPARFTQADDTNAENERDRQGCYLIGLSEREGLSEQQKTDSERKTAQGVLHATLETFAERIRGDEKYFDAATSWVDVTLVKRSEVQDLVLDNSQWGDYLAQDYESDSEDEEEEDDFELDGEDEEWAAARPKASSKLKKSPSTKSKARPVAGKLRPATDVYNRVRWDPNMDSSDYIIGYDDRFLGVREIGLDKWKTEQTDEEFIPQHRIMYFRRKSDGVVVWDRESRKDNVYGSGAGKG